MRGYAQQIKERNSRIGENCEKFKQPFRTYSEDQILHIGLWYFYNIYEDLEKQEIRR